MARPRKVSAMLAAARHEQRRLADWMALNHDDLLDQFGPGRIDWRPFMKIIAKLDLRDEHGQSVTRDTAARTWARVRRRVADRRMRKAAKTGPPLWPGEVAPGVRLVGVATGPVPRPFLELDIVPARPREASPASAGPPSAGADVHAAKLLRTAIDGFGASRVPMPKPLRGS